MRPPSSHSLTPRTFLWLLVLLPLLTSCDDGFICGEGTHEEDGYCVLDDGDGDADVDVDADVDAGSDDCTDLDAGTDSGPDAGCEPNEKNSPPRPPEQLYPLGTCALTNPPFLKVANAFDADGDTLRYHFEVDSTPRFSSANLQTTRPDGIPEGSSGFTEWRVPCPLMFGPVYYWRTWVTDCTQASEKTVELFQRCQ